MIQMPLIVGDVHGKVDAYWKLLQKETGFQKPVIQLGDLGLEDAHRWHQKNLDPALHRVVFGNHDHYPNLGMDYSCGDFRYFDEWDLMTIRGAVQGIDQYDQEPCDRIIDVGFELFMSKHAGDSIHFVKDPL